MKLYLPVFIVLVVVSALSCSDPEAEKRAAEHADSIKALPTMVDTLRQKEVTYSSGEVLVAFKPMSSEMEKYHVSVEQMAAYESWYNTVVVPFAKEKGRATSSTDDENIVLNLSKANRYTVQRSMYPEPFGLIITKEGNSPIILHELASREKIEAALK